MPRTVALCLLLGACGHVDDERREPSLSDEIELSGKHPRVAIADDGTSLVVFTHDGALLSRRFVPGVGWQEPIIVQHASTSSSEIDAQTLESRDGHTLLTFRECQELACCLWVTWQTSDGSWQEPVLLQGDPPPDQYFGVVQSVSATLGDDRRALVSWVWGGNVESGGAREIRYSLHAGDNWTTTLGPQTSGLPGWRPAILAPAEGGGSTVVIAEDYRLRTLRCQDGGACTEMASFANQSSPGFMPSLAVRSNGDALALISAYDDATTRLVAYSNATSSWEALGETEIPRVDASLTVRAETTALVTWAWPDSGPHCDRTLMGALHRRNNGTSPPFAIQPAGPGVMTHAAASADSGEMLVAWTAANTTASSQCELHSVWLRTAHPDGTLSAPHELGLLDPAAYPFTSRVTVAIANSGAGVIAWANGIEQLRIARVK